MAKKKKVIAPKKILSKKKVVEGLTNKGKPRQRASQNRLKHTDGIPIGEGRKIKSSNKEYAIGNNWWTRRTKHGRDKLFESADLLWQQACVYFDWCKANPLYESKLASQKGIPKVIQVAKIRVFTLEGLC